MKTEAWAQVSTWGLAASIRECYPRIAFQPMTKAPLYPSDDTYSPCVQRYQEDPSYMPCPTTKTIANIYCKYANPYA